MGAVKTDVSEENVASIFRVEIIGGLQRVSSN
jgi:hypothetical protein